MISTFSTVSPNDWPPLGPIRLGVAVRIITLAAMWDSSPRKGLTVEYPARWLHHPFVQCGDPA